MTLRNRAIHFTQPTTTHSISDDFTFRFNRRKSASRGKLFYRLAQ